MVELSKIVKFIKIILLQNEEPLSYPEIQNKLRIFKIEVSELEVLEALNTIEEDEKELVQSSLDQVQVDQVNRSSHYVATELFRKKHKAKILILNNLMHSDEMHISTIEDQLAEIKCNIQLHKIIEDMEAESLIRFTTTDHCFITVTSVGREYLSALPMIN